jgi:hypothetical protein
VHHTASRIVRHLGQLGDDRTKIDAVESEAVEARAFVLLLFLAAAWLRRCGSWMRRIA